jgi:hypothetical protein
MKKEMILILGILLLGFGSAINISENVLKEAIIPELNHPAVVQLSISDANSGLYNTYTLTDVEISPKDFFNIKSGENIVDLLIYPTEALTIRGYYSFTYYVREDRTSTNHEDKIVVNIVDLKDAFEISSEANMPDDNTVTFFVKNKVKADLKDLNADFSTSFFTLQDQKFDLDAGAIKVFEVNVKDLKKIEAGSYILNANFDVVKGSGNVEGKVYLGEKQGIETKHDSEGFIIRTDSVTKTNVGNVGQEVTMMIKRNAFTRLLTTFNFEPTGVDRDGWDVTYVWSKELGPAESFTLEAKTNYVFPLLVVIALILLTGAFKKFYTKKVEVTKSVSPVRTRGGQFALRVKLRVKAMDSVQNLSVVDKVPAVVKVHELFDGIKPNKIDTVNRRIEWNLGNLEAGEERVFSYLVFSRVGVVGRFALPEAVALFEKGSEIHETRSNIVYFLSEQAREE